MLWNLDDIRMTVVFKASIEELAFEKVLSIICDDDGRLWGVKVGAKWEGLLLDFKRFYELPLA